MRTVAAAKEGVGLDTHAPRARRQSEHAEAPFIEPYKASDLGTGIDPRDPVHHSLWAHELDGSVGGPTTERLVTENPLAHPGHMLASGFFGMGDFALHHGGQVVLDGAGFIPGVNVITEGAQAGYHTLHAAYDASEGNTRERNEELWEAGEHTICAGLNLVSGEGGNAAKAVGHAVEDAEHVAEEGGTVHHLFESGEQMRSRMRAGLGIKRPLVTADAAHKAHNAFDAAETGWDTTASVVEEISGTHVPFVGGLVPWMRSSEEKE